MDHFFFINSSVDGHFGCFRILATVKAAAVQLLQPLSSRFWSSQVRGPTLGLLDGMVARFYISFFGVCGTMASHCCGLSRCGAQAPDVHAQRLCLTGLATLRHVGSSRTGARTRVPCIVRWTLNHCTTREAPVFTFKRGPFCSHYWL